MYIYVKVNVCVFEWIRRRLASRLNRLGVRAVAHRLASPYRFKNIDTYMLQLLCMCWLESDAVKKECLHLRREQFIAHHNWQEPNTESIAISLTD